MNSSAKLASALAGVLLLIGGIYAVVLRDISALWFSLMLATVNAFILIVLPLVSRWLNQIAYKAFGPDLNNIKFKISQLFIWFGSALFCSSCILFAAVWRKAALDGMVPEKWGLGSYGNHGPWVNYAAGIHGLEQVYILLLCAGAAALVSLLFRASRIGVVLIGISVTALFVIFLTHFWLTD